MDYLELMRGAGLGDVLIPKKEFVKEHERLVALLNQSDIPALRKEARDQQAELAKEGGSGKSNFIARLMAEQKYKHAVPADKGKPYRPARGKNKDPNPTQGAYRKPVMDPEVDETKMSQPIKFNYRKIANKKQLSSGENAGAYGASPFITHHFGLAQSSAKPKENAYQKAARKGFTVVKPKAEAKAPAPLSKGKPKAARNVADPERFGSTSVARNMMKYSPGLLFENKIRELIRPTKGLVRKGESPIRTPAEQQDVDRQLRALVKEMDDNDYDPKRLGIKGFDADKYR